MPLELSKDALSTPEGFAHACRQARTYVEANIPGDHKPVPHCFFNYSDNVVVGCGCAVGYLITSLTDSLALAREYGSWKRLLSFGLPDDATSLSAFEKGFDNGLEGRGDLSHSHQGWIGAGMRLGREWQPIFSPQETKT